MVWIFVAVAVIVFVLGLFLWMIHPGLDRNPKMRPFEHTLIAHRGLHDNQSVAPENSMQAFERAVNAGFGIELDVQMTSDGKLVVFHDWDTLRMCGVDCKISEHTYAELRQLPLGVSDERIPLFSDVLKLVNGTVPLVVEIKVGWDYKKTTEAVAAMMEDYAGVYCVECFNPLALSWYRKHVPQVIRGLLSMDYHRDSVKMPGFVKFMLTHLMLNFCAEPDFISYNHKDRKKRGFQLCRKLFKVKTAAWTIQSETELEDAKKWFDMFIFDGFLPYAESKVEG
jgi:glycerophosphoryl diester phosphodiesterase